MSADWRKKDVDSSCPTTSSIAGGSGISSNFQDFEMIPNNAIFGLTNNGNQTNNTAINFEQFNSSPERLLKMQQLMESGVNEQSKVKIMQLVDQISQLKQTEKLLLYLKMPGSSNEVDPLRQPQNPLGTRLEISQTINWVRSHLEHDSEVSIPKQDVYNDYTSYCERLNIKPLSTADFGKVMKQVFPEIKPRRLGTRGHSRYCYAAMRKTTKLSPPSLPTLGKASIAEETDEIYNQSLDEECWKPIKIWAEGLLNSTFKNIRDLSTHIQKHQLNTPASNSSRHLLQKKLLQKESKEKKKYTECSSFKKRRKRKRKNSSSSESTTQQTELFLEKTEEVNKIHNLPLISVKQEIQEIPRLHAFAKDSVIFNAIQSDIPMNLAAVNTSENSNKLPPATRQTDLVQENSNGILQPPPLTIVKEEVSVEDYSNIPVFCKKVRQAQQAKGLWAGPISSSHSTMLTQQSVITSNYSNCSNLVRSAINDISLVNETAKVTSLNSQQIRAKKIRFLQEREQLQLDDTSSSEKDSTLPENLGLPRERVISICNMDKKELDDYLNVTEESEDQDPELLQYFQTGESDNKTTSIGQISTNTNALQDINKININNGKFENKSVVTLGNTNQINQLRCYLYQNLNENKSVLGFNSDNSINSGPGSASTSLTILSQKHTIPTVDHFQLSSMMSDSNFVSARKMSHQSYINKKRLNAISQNDFRGKHWNFVPISTATNTSEMFASPRATPVIRKNVQISKPMDQQISSGNIDSASAPSSPSTLPSHIKFVTNGNISISEQEQFSPYNNEQIKQQFATDSEGRSQSVPLHYKNNNNNSPIFVNTNYNEFSSTCNSIAHTPVPHEFNDFEIFSDENTQHQNTIAVSSRSVPSTPLINNIKNQRSLFQSKDVNLMMNNNDGKILSTAKSMPTTPISSRGIISNIFRYSPDFNRDSLINGNTYCNDSFDGVNSILPNPPMENITNSALCEEIQELEQFGNVDDMF